ncbi:MAG: hypothetical protein Q4F69_03265, partial [Bacteroidia bacterium]|nr:hypothetical protein [Bacteroidia bacterium]
ITIIQSFSLKKVMRITIFQSFSPKNMIRITENAGFVYFFVLSRCDFARLLHSSIMSSTILSSGRYSILLLCV